MSIYALASMVGAQTGLSLIGAFAQYQQGQFGKEVASRQSEALEIEARQIQQEAGAKIAADDYRASQVLGSQVVETAARGITEEGSPAVIQATSAEEAKINDMYTKYAANIQATNLYYQGTIGKAQAEEGAQAATIGALTSGVTGPIEAGIEAYSLKTKTAPPSWSGNW